MLPDNTQFDFIIVGAGAAGSVLANRLSESGKYSVCVLEAGPEDTSPFIHIPAGFVKTLVNPTLMWQFRSEPSEGTGGRSIKLPQGRVLGGSTSINGLVYNRGQPQDYDGWASRGNPGWSYQDVLPYFRRTETRDDADSQYRGSLGPMYISDPAWRDPLCDSFIESVAGFGVPTHNDYNGPSQLGAGYYQRFIRGRSRVSAAKAYLKPARQRKNVEVLTGTRVARIITDQRRATGVLYRKSAAGNGQQPEMRSLMARHEVVVSAGSVNSAHLLQLSGIGNGPMLQSFDIPVVHHLPAVGENLQDHYFVRCSARLKKGAVSLNQRAKGWRVMLQIARWGLCMPSILALSPSVAYAFLNSDNMNSHPDLQLVFSPGSYKPGRVYELDNFPAVTCGFTQQRPSSKGFVRLKSPDLDVAPVIQPNYLETVLDQQVAIKGVNICRQILQNAPLSDVYDKEVVPGTATTTDKEILEFARNTGNTGYHLVGTCCMGPASSTGAVVSPELRVHGIKGLRVIDASIMPTVTSSNTCAASLMIGEKGADLILEAVEIQMKN